MKKTHFKLILALTVSSLSTSLTTSLVASDDLTVRQQHEEIDRALWRSMFSMEAVARTKARKLTNPDFQSSFQSFTDTPKTQSKTKKSSGEEMDVMKVLETFCKTDDAIKEIKCPFTDNQIDAIKCTLNDSISYTKALMKNLRIGRKDIQRKLDISDLSYAHQLKLSLCLKEKCITYYEKCLLGLELIQNTVDYNLTDIEVRDTAYQKIQWELAFMVRLFEPNKKANSKVVFNDDQEVSKETLHSIFEELRNHFPRVDADEMTTIMFYSQSRIWKMPEHYEAIETLLDKKIIFNDAEASQKIEQLKQEARDKFTPPLIETERWKNRNKMGSFHENVLSIDTLSVDLESSSVTTVQEGTVSDVKAANTADLEKSIEEPEVTIESASAFIVTLPLYDKQKEPDQSEEVKQRPLNNNVSSNDTIDNDVEPHDEKITWEDPSEAHKRFQKMKQDTQKMDQTGNNASTALKTSSVDNQFAIFTQELLHFLNTSIYGKEKKLSWKVFKGILQNNGFSIEKRLVGQKGKGSAHKVTFSDGRSFTVHKPTPASSPMPLDYFTYIQSGFKHVFKLSRDIVDELVGKLAV